MAKRPLSVHRTIFKGRKALTLQSNALRASVLLGGGHLAEIYGKAARISPLWIPPWKTIEPWRFARRGKPFGQHTESKLLSAITGHNLCLGHFGPPSDAEFKADQTAHGEAGVIRWQVVSTIRYPRCARATITAVLPNAQLEVVRHLRVRPNEPVLEVETCIRNLVACDQPLTYNEHVTVGPPFLEKGVTLFDIPADWGQVIDGDIGGPNRLAQGKEFSWPKAPAAKGRKMVDLRLASTARRNSDFTTQRVNPKNRYSWFTAINPARSVMTGYIFPRSFFPWIGNWEENYGRKAAPWNGRALTRAMEFGICPWPIPKRQAVELGRLKRQPTYRWIDALGEIRYRFAAFVVPFSESWSQVKDLDVSPGKIVLSGRNDAETIEIPFSGKIS